MASATVRLQDGAGDVTRCEERASDMCAHKTVLAQCSNTVKGGEGNFLAQAARVIKSRGWAGYCTRENVRSPITEAVRKRGSGIGPQAMAPTRKLRSNGRT